MTDQSHKLQCFGTYVFAVMLLAIGVFMLAVNVASFAKYPTTGCLGGALLGLLFASSAVVIFVRTKRRNPTELASSSSWPHWFMLLMLLFLMAPMGIKDGNFVRIRLQGYIAGLFALRWGLAALRRERNRDWILYCVVAVLLYPALATVGSWFI